MNEPDLKELCKENGTGYLRHLFCDYYQRHKGEIPSDRICNGGRRIPYGKHEKILIFILMAICRFENKNNSKKASEIMQNLGYDGYETTEGGERFVQKVENTLGKMRDKGIEKDTLNRLFRIIYGQLAQGENREEAVKQFSEILANLGVYSQELFNDSLPFNDSPLTDAASNETADETSTSTTNGDGRMESESNGNSRSLNEPTGDTNSFQRDNKDGIGGKGAIDFSGEIFNPPPDLSPEFDELERQLEDYRLLYEQQLQIIVNNHRESDGSIVDAEGMRNEVHNLYINITESVYGLIGPIENYPMRMSEVIEQYWTFLSRMEYYNTTFEETVRGILENGNYSSLNDFLPPY